MRNLIIFTFLFSSFVQAQTFTIFENNKKNKALFDYNDPNSLVSMLVQNQGLITSDGLQCELSSEGFYSIDGLKNYALSGEHWEIEGDDANATKTVLLRNSDSESFDDWFTRLTTQGDVPDYDPEVFGALTRTDKLILEKQYNSALVGLSIKLPPVNCYYDVHDIELIFVNANNIYFAQKSAYENKFFICLQLTLEELAQLGRFDYLNEELSKKITGKLREFQLQKREIDSPEYPVYAIEEYSNQHRNATLFDDFNKDEFKYYNQSSSIKRIFPGTQWEIQGDDVNATMTILTRDSDSEKFEDWYMRLTTQGSAPYFDPEVFGYLTRTDKLILKKQYEACGENQALLQPDSELTYWVDYPNPAIYLQRNFETDSTGKFATEFSQLLITERLENKKGYSQKPQVLMAFGDTFASINQEILDLLKEELMQFEMKQDFAWKKIINSKKGRIVKNDELKKMIHCFEINDNGIEY